MQAHPPPWNAILRYVYPGVTPKNGRVVLVGDGEGEGEFRFYGGEIVEKLEEDGVDTGRWHVRYYDKRLEGWLKLKSGELFTFPAERKMLELCLEPAPIAPSFTTADDKTRSENLRSQSQCTDGYFGIGVVGGKNEQNNGTLWRSAWQLGASFTFTVGARYEKTSADTTKTWTSLPAYDYPDFNAFAQSSPFSARWVAVEMGGTPLSEFQHPDRAVYLLGSEDNGLPSSVLKACKHHVSLPVSEIPGRTASFNVAVTGSIILFDRLEKAKRKASLSSVKEGDSLPGGRLGVDSAKPSQVLSGKLS